MTYRTLFFCIALGAIAAGCGGPGREDGRDVTTDEIRKETREALDATGRLIIQKKEEFMTQTRKELETMDARIEELQVKAEAASAEKRAEIKEDIRKLREEYAAAKSRMEEFQSSGEKAWEDMKSGMEDAMKDLQKAYDRARSHFS